LAAWDGSDFSPVTQFLALQREGKPIQIFPGKKLGKRPELNQYHFPGCVLEVFGGLDVNRLKRLHLDLNLEGA
jgi:hypothetical protein